MKYLNWKIFAFLLYAFLLFNKDLNLFIEPRFWAEEASVYFKDAYFNGFSAIFSFHQGYYSIVPNVSTYISTFVDLKYAPVITTAVAFVIQLIPAYIIIFFEVKPFEQLSSKIMMLVAVLFSGFTIEVFSQTLASQFHLLIVLFLLLIADLEKMSKKWLILVIVAGLSGPPANMLAPFFLLKFYLYKRKPDIIIFSFLVFTTAIQLFAVITSEPTYAQYGMQRGAHLNYDYLVKIIGMSFFYMHAHTPLTVDLFTVISASVLVAFFASDNRESSNVALFYLIPLVFLTFLMSYTSLGGGGGGRYAYPTCVMLSLMLARMAFTWKNKYMSFAIICIFAMNIYVSYVKYYNAVDGYYSSKDWSLWSEQVQLFKEGKTTELLIYPQWESHMWKVNLSSDE